MKKLLLLPLLALVIGCGSLGEILDDSYVANGGQCATQSWQVYYYEPDDDTWVYDKFISVMPDGTDIKYNEENWVVDTGNKLVKGALGVFYRVSPHSGFRYRFEIECDKWHPL